MLEQNAAPPPSSPSSSSSSAPASTSPVQLVTSIDAHWPNDLRCYIAALHRAELLISERIAKRLEQTHLEHQQEIIQQQQQQNKLSGSASSPFLPSSSKGDAAEPLQPQDSFLGQLTEQQLKAVRMASSARIMLLTGDAGCGKTLTTRAIVQDWVAQGKKVSALGTHTHTHT